MCKVHSLFEALNRDKTVNIEKRKKTRRHLMHFTYCLGTHSEGKKTLTAKIDTCKVAVRMKTCEIFA